MADLLLYKMNTCPYCQKVMRYMRAESIDIPMRDITEDPLAKADLEEIGGKVQVPCLIIDGKPMYESDDIVDYLRESFGGDAPAAQDMTGAACPISPKN